VDELTRLFLAARDGDRTALLDAVRSSQTDVWRLAYHLVGPDDADDVTQDAFVRAWKVVPAFRGNSSARTWLLSITRRACADQVRRSVRHRRMGSRLEQRASLLGAASAAACGVPVGTIRSRVARAREQLVDAVRRAETG
jgi:RNA polymerase sigma-70 factor, ECF subfamily